MTDIYQPIPNIYDDLCNAIKTCLKKDDTLKHVTIVDELSDSDRLRPWVEIGTDQLVILNNAHSTEIEVITNFELLFACDSGPDNYNQAVNLVFAAVNNLKNGVGNFGIPVFNGVTPSFTSPRNKTGVMEGISTRVLDISFKIGIADIDQDLLVSFDPPLPDAPLFDEPAA